MPGPLARLLTLALPIMLGCQHDHLSQPELVDDSALYWELTLDRRAVTMATTAPYDTLTVTATPRNVHGDPLTGLPAPIYQTTDIDRVQVTSQGVVVALQQTPAPVAIVAELTTNNLKHVDTTWVRVVDNPTPPVLASLSIHPIPPDSAKAAAVDRTFDVPSRVFRPRALDGSGAPIPDLLVEFRSSDATTALVANLIGIKGERGVDTAGRLFGNHPGTVSVYATATAFGVTKADTLPFRIGWPVSAGVSVVETAPVLGGSPVNSFSPTELRVGVGAIVAFTILGIDHPVAPIDVTFADADLPNVAAPSAFSEFANPDYGLVSGFSWELVCAAFGPLVDCGAGDFVLDQNAAFAAARVFPVPGTYTYHSTTFGTGGRIAVIADQ